MSSKAKQKTAKAGRLKDSLNAQSKSVGPSKQQSSVATCGGIVVKDELNHKREIVTESAFNVDVRKESSDTPHVEDDTSKATVIVLGSDDELSDGWVEDDPKPDPVSSRGDKGQSKCVVDRKGGPSAKAKRRGAPSSAKPRQPKGKKQARAKRGSLGNDSSYLRPGSGRHIQQSLTDHFPVRRSSRKCKSTIECERQEEMIFKLLSQDEEGLQVMDIAQKGRGVVTTRAFKRGELLCEYAGELLTEEEAKRVEEEYRRDPSIGCYMYYFSHQGKRHCVDATKESGRMGRLVNHSRKQANVVTKMVTLPERPCLCLVAARDIQPGEELQYDYGDHSKAAEEAHPWLKF